MLSYTNSLKRNKLLLAYQSRCLWEAHRRRLLRPYSGIRNPEQSYESERTFTPHNVPTLPHTSNLEQLVRSQGSQARRLPPRFKHLNLYEDRVSLPVKVLGEPAAIRIVRDKPPKPRQSPSERSEPVNKESLKEFLKDATAQVEASSEEEALSNIELIRKTFFDKIGKIGNPYLEECQTVGQTLFDGFTVNQLEAYVDRTGAATAADVDDLDAPLKEQSYARSRWSLGDGVFPRDADKRRGSYTLGEESSIVRGVQTGTREFRQTKKTRAVEKILRLCWKLRPLEEKQLQGSLEFVMDTNALALLLQSNNEILKGISEVNGVKVDVAPTLGTVRVVGYYEACAVASQTLASYAQNIRLESFNLGPRVHLIRPNRRPLLDKLESLTKTRIVVKDDQNVDVYYLGPHFKLQDMQRLFSQVREYYEQEPPSAHWYAEDHVPVLIPFHSMSCLKFYHEQERWYRWRERDLGSSGPRTMRQIAMPASKSMIIQELMEKFRVSWPALPSNHWESRPEQTVSAYFGSIIHAVSDPWNLEPKLDQLARHRKQKNANLNSAFKLLTGRRRTLATSTPGIHEVMNQLASDPPTVIDKIRVSLKPDLPRFPTLELEVHLDNDARTAKLDTATLIYDRRIADLLLPAHPVDVRFISQASFSAMSSNFDPALLTFLANSNLNVWGNERLQTPQTLVLNLPSHTVGGAIEVDKDIRYSFASLAVISSMITLHQGFPLVLSTVEAGQSGGRSEELRIDLPRYSDRASEEPGKNRIDGGSSGGWDAQFLMWYGAVKEAVGKIPR